MEEEEDERADSACADSNWVPIEKGELRPEKGFIAKGWVVNDL